MKVGDHSRADVWCDWHPRPLPPLGANKNLAGSPIDVIQGEIGNLVGPQAKLGQHHHDGVVAPPHCGCSVATIEDLLNLRSREVGRQTHELPLPDGGHAAGQRKWVHPRVMKVSKKCAQRPAHCLAGLRAPILGVTLDIADHVLLTDLAEVSSAGGANFTQEPADRRQMAHDTHRCQTTLGSQIVAELRKDPVLRRVRLQGRRRDRAGGAQNRKPPLQRRPVARLDGLLLSSVP